MPIDDTVKLSGEKLEKRIDLLHKRMREAASNLEFEEAAKLRDEIKGLEALRLEV